MKLFSFAYAGGDGHIFYPIAKELKSCNVTMIPFYYKGRGGRLDEGNYESIMEMAIEAAHFIQKHEVTDGYALLGHSMGSIVAYECFYELKRRGFQLPSAIYFAGSMPPDQLIQNRFVLDDDEAFIDKLKELGGLDLEILEVPEFRSFFLPIIQNDIKNFQEYVFEEKDEKITIPVTILTGSFDQVSGEKVSGWKNHSSMEPSFIELDGDHFFLFKGNQNYKAIFKKIITEA
ncbi:thioesterase domain-containing protein [Gottfriedia acidiceleris]|uniref:thioesterase II family protein n=1 Tax=Gottfriedia acidiceleris TaxID=371036 RepID=UPI002F26426B